jgi:serine/threonine protein kinase
MVKYNRHSNSTVYFGIDRALKTDGTYANRKVAIKLVSLEGDNAQARMERYNREVSAFHEVDSPHIVPLYRITPAQQSSAFVMRRITGPTLEEARLQIRWTRPMAARLFSHVADALSAVHEHHIIHGDVHIGNVMLWKPLNPKTPGHFHAYLLDFGLSNREDGGDFCPRKDIQGLATLMMMVLWPHRDTVPDYSRGLTQSLVWVLLRAMREDGPYRTIQEFSDAFYLALRRSRKPNIIKRPPSAYSSYQLAQATFADDRSEVPTEPYAPIPSLQEQIETAEIEQVSIEEKETQEADKVIVHDNLTQSIAPLNRSPMYAMGVGIVIGIVLSLMTLIVFVTLSVNHAVPPPILDAPIIGVMGGTLALLNPTTRAVLHIYHEYPANSIAYSGNGRYLVAERAILDLHTGELKRRFNYAPHPKAVALNYDGSILALHDGKMLSLWDVNTGRRLHLLSEIGVGQVPTLFTDDGYDLLREILLQAYF